MLVRGRWWVPDSPRRKVPGFLTFTQDVGARLECDGSIRSGLPESCFPPSELSILGTGVDGRKLTLLEAHCAEQCWFGPGVNDSTSTYRPLRVLVGDHFRGKEHLVFDRITMRCPALTEWGKSQVFWRERDEQDAEHLIFRSPESLSTSCVLQDAGGSDELDIRISIDWSFKDHLRRDSYTVAAVALLSMCLERPVALEALLVIFDRVVLLLELGARAPLVPEYLSLFRPETGQREFRLFQRRPHRTDENGFWPNMYFTLPDIRERFGPLVTAWLKAGSEGRLDAVCELFRELLYQLGTPAYRFLSAVSALESYHRRVIGGGWIDKKTAKEHRALMLEALPATHRRQWEKKLAYGHEFTLRERLGQIVDKLSHVSNYLRIDSRFLQMVVDTRNYYHHWDRNLQERAMPPSAVGIATEKLRVLLEGLLLTEAGLSPEEASKCIEQSSSARQVAEYRLP